MRTYSDVAPSLVDRRPRGRRFDTTGSRHDPVARPARVRVARAATGHRPAGLETLLLRDAGVQHAGVRRRLRRPDGATSEPDVPEPGRQGHAGPDDDLQHRLLLPQQYELTALFGRGPPLLR